MDQDMVYVNNKCDTHPDSSSIFDSESYGSLEITESIKQVIQEHKISTHMSFISYIDNKSVTDSIQGIVKRENIPSQTPCYKIVRQIRENLNTPNLKRTWEWDQWHQNNSK